MSTPNLHADGQPDALAVPVDEQTRIIERAVRLCYERGQNLTPIRRRVLELLASSRAPISAYALVDQLRAGKPLQATTVYRALEFLIEARLVRHVAQCKAYICCGSFDEQMPVALLMCTGCGKVDEIASTPLRETISQMAAPHGFDPAYRSIEISGRCMTCQGTSAL